MSGTRRFSEALLSKIALPVLGMSGLALHLFTVWTAFRLARPGASQYVAALAAYVAPPASEVVVAYFAWRDAGSKVNSYSVWLLVWLMLLLAVVVLVRIDARSRRVHRGCPDPSRAD